MLSAGEAWASGGESCFAWADLEFRNFILIFFSLPREHAAMCTDHGLRHSSGFKVAAPSTIHFDFDPGITSPSFAPAFPYKSLLKKAVQDRRLTGVSRSARTQKSQPTFGSGCLQSVGESLTGKVVADPYQQRIFPMPLAVGSTLLARKNVSAGFA